MKRRFLPGSLFLLALVVGCPAKAPVEPSTTSSGDDATGDLRATALAAGAARPRDDADYLADGPEIPVRVGIHRRFLRRSQTNLVRDPVFVPGTSDVLVVARAGPAPAIWRLSLDKPDPAVEVVVKPLHDPKTPVSAKNRGDWFIGSPRAFPDGKHVIFDASRNTPRERFGHVLGIASLENGLVEPVEIKGVTQARTPDVAPDGETVVFASCTELRSAKLSGRGAQVVESKVIREVPVVPDVRKGHMVCTAHRPRISRDGKMIVFEGIGQYMRDDFRKEFFVPDALNPGDYVIEPWIMNADGSGLRRLISDDAYAMIGGRVQTGGTKEPDFSPDGTSVVFSHGNGIAVVGVDGKTARMIASGVTEVGAMMTFQEADPTYASDGKTVVSASNLIGGEERGRIAPPGLAVIDLVALDRLAEQTP